MNNDFTHTELLIRYLDDELQPAEKLEVEKKLAEDLTWQAEFEQLKLARQAVKLYGLKEQVKAIRGEMRTRKHPTPVRSIVRSSLRVAAVLILVVAGIAVYLYATLSNEKLFDQQYQPFEVRGNRGADNQGEIESAYKNKDWQKLIDIFNQSSLHSTADYFYMGQMYLQRNEPRGATSYLELALASSDTSHTYKDESEYYLALALLKGNRLHEAHEILMRIHEDPNHLFHDRVSSWFLRKLSILDKK